eukprot:scaffold1687_cov405-Prasinococcus_capsulatus_cf.AAC.35
MHAAGATTGMSPSAGDITTLSTGRLGKACPASEPARGDVQLPPPHAFNDKSSGRSSVLCSSDTAPPQHGH